MCFKDYTNATKGEFIDRYVTQKKLFRSRLIDHRHGLKSKLSRKRSVAISNRGDPRVPRVQCNETLSRCDLSPRSLYVLTTTETCSSLFGSSEANSSLAKIINGIPLSEECVAKDCQWAYGLGEVHSHEAGNARSLDLKNVIMSSNAEVVAAQVERDVWQITTLIALNSVLSVVALLGTNLLV